LHDLTLKRRTTWFRSWSCWDRYFIFINIASSL